MSVSVASYQQLAHQVEALQKENSHLRQELEDNVSHLAKLEAETSDMKEMLKKLQCKLEQEASEQVSNEKLDVLEQLKELHLDFTNYCEAKHQPHHLHALEGLATPNNEEEAGPEREQSRCQDRSVSEEEVMHFQAPYLLEGILARGSSFGPDDCTEPHLEFMELTKERTRMDESEREKAERQAPSYLPAEFIQMDQVGVNQLETDTVEVEQPRQKRLDMQVEMMFWQMSMLAMRDREEMSHLLLAMSSSQDGCVVMRRSGCVPLLVQLLHEDQAEGGGCSHTTQSRASAALHNIVYGQTGTGQGLREIKVLNLLEQIRAHCEGARDWIENHEGAPASGHPEPLEHQLCQATCTLMKLSFEVVYRRAISELGGLQALADLMHLDHSLYGLLSDPLHLALRRYAGMTLTNLTFGDVVNKVTLCSKKESLHSIVAQLSSDSEELHQVVSSILRNLSWGADLNSKKILREAGSVVALMTCALEASKESTLKSILSALWNLSAHSTENKEAICSVDGALSFLVSTLTYKCQSNSLAIMESGGGILRNISSFIAARQEYRQVLRNHNCLHTLLCHLRSHSLTIVSNACGTLWNLSARCLQDQELLWDLGAVAMLRNLIHSKHKMIAMGSAATLRNLISNRPLKYKDAPVVSPGTCMPSLFMRKQKALETELQAKHLTESFDSTESPSPKNLTMNRFMAKDYASDSGCFDDDEITNVSSSLDTGSFSAFSYPIRKDGIIQVDHVKKPKASGDQESVLVENLGKNLFPQVSLSKQRKDNLTPASQDCFNLISYDRFVNWHYGLHALPDTGDKTTKTRSKNKDRLIRSQALLRLKKSYKSSSTDSQYSDSASEGYSRYKGLIPMAGSPNVKEHNMADFSLASSLNREATCDLVETDQSEHGGLSLPTTTDKQNKQHTLTTKPGQTVLETNTAINTSSLSYNHVPTRQIMGKLTLDPIATDVSTSLAMRRKAWFTVAPVSSELSPTVGEIETVKKYSVENTPICFSRCSSLSSLSSGEGEQDQQIQTENKLEGNSLHEMLERDKSDKSNCKDTTTEKRLFSSTSSNTISKPIEIPHPHNKDNVLLTGILLGKPKEINPSNCLENLNETPLVMSPCSSVSSLGSFESPSIASSIQSNPCSELNSGALSPSEIPDSPGQHMSPSHCKTPCCTDVPNQEAEVSAGPGQAECSLQRFMEGTDFEEFKLPSQLDTLIYFTVEKPVENFSCASSLSALPLHEHYIQKDVELKLMPLNQKDNDVKCTLLNKNANQQGSNYPSGTDTENEGGLYSEGTSDDDLEILKECINSAMPSKYKTVNTSLVSAQCTPFQKCQLLRPIHYNCLGMSDDTNKSETDYHGKNSIITCASKSALCLSKEVYSTNIKNKLGKTSSGTVISREKQRITKESKSEKIHHVKCKGRCTTEHKLHKEMETDQFKNPSEKNSVPRRTFPHKAQSLGTKQVYQQAGMKAEGSISTSDIVQKLETEQLDTYHQPCSGDTLNNLIIDETLPSCSLSSSLCSLSEPDFEKDTINSKQVGTQNESPIHSVKHLHSHFKYDRDSSSDSTELDSEDDLLQKCIISGMPKQNSRIHMQSTNVNHTSGCCLQRNLEVLLSEREENSGRTYEEDLSSVHWKTIQEEANFIVTSLKSMSSSQKLLPNKSTLMPIHHSKHEKDVKKNSIDLGRTSNESQKKEATTHSIQQHLPKISREYPGNTLFRNGMICKTETLVQKPTDKRSESLHRVWKYSEPSKQVLPKRSSTQPPQPLKSSPSRSEKESQRKSAPLFHTNKRIQKEVKPFNYLKNQNKHNSSTPLPKLEDSNCQKQRRLQKSPVRIPFIQTPSGQQESTRKMSLKSKTPKQDCQTVIQSNKEGSGYKGLLRQLTFIKESSNVTQFEQSQKDNATENFQEAKTTGQVRQQHLGKKQEQIKTSKQGVMKKLSTKASHNSIDLTAKCYIRRASSESPCRKPQSSIMLTPRSKRETSARHSSSLSINRTNSHSSILTRTSDLNGKEKILKDYCKGQERRARTHHGSVAKSSSLLGQLESTPQQEQNAGNATVETEEASTNKTDSTTSSNKELCPGTSNMP